MTTIFFTLLSTRIDVHLNNPKSMNDRSNNDNRQMSWQDAILKVLSQAIEPLDYHEITRQIGEQGLRPLSGATPATTVNRNLGILIAECKVVRMGRGKYALPETAERSEQEEAAEEAAAAPGRLTVKAYGLYWDRNVVDWNPVAGKLWGQQEENATPVNFADQDGIYLLHCWSEIVYVGQTFTRTHEEEKRDCTADSEITTRTMIREKVIVGTLSHGSDSNR